MTRFSLINQHITIASLLFCLSFNVAANEFQEADKLYKQGQNDKALVKIEALLLTQPKNTQARFLKAVILTEQGQTDEAARIYTALTEDNPELPEPYNNLAALYAAQGQYDKAKLALEKALRTHPSYATAHENLGDIYAKMASQAYDRALQLDRANNNSKTKLALVKEVYTPPVKTNAAGKTQIASAAVTTPVATTKPLATPIIATASAPVVATAEPVVPKPVSAEVAASNPQDEVLKAVHAWAGSWSARNSKKYLAAYAKDFKTPNNESRDEWEQQRRDRLAKPQPIVVTLLNAAVKMQDDKHATVSFVQSYRSGSLKSTTRKTLEMVKTSDTWQILSERAGK